MYRQELRRALAVIGNLLGEFLAELVERLEELGVVLASLRDRRIAGRAVGHNDGHVVRAHVAVDRDHVEGRRDDLGERLLQELAGDDAEAHLLAAELDLERRRLWMRIRRHDGLARRAAAVRRELADGVLDAHFQLVHRQRHADDARRSNDDILWRAAEHLGSDLLRRLGVLFALLARAGIGTAGIGADGVRRARGDDGLRGEDRRCRYRVLREGAGDSRFLLRVDDGDIEVAALFDAGLDTGGLEALRERDARFIVKCVDHMGFLLNFNFNFVCAPRITMLRGTSARSRGPSSRRSRRRC